MPPPPILEPAQFANAPVVAGVEDIEATNPHRFEFRLLDGVTYLDIEKRLFAGFHDVREDAYWVRGHIPERPLLPGVLMIEAAAQLASFAHHRIFETGKFLGFVGVDNVKFRGTVEPPARLILVGRGKKMKPRQMICELQGFVDETMVFEAEITGMGV